MKTAPDHYSSSTKLYSWHYALALVAFFWHPPNPDSSVRLPDAEAWFTTPENAFPLIHSPMAARFTPLQPTLGIAHGDLRLVCSCLAMETHFMKLPTNSSCAGCFQRQFGTLCCNRGHSAIGGPVLSLCGLPLHGWSVVAPRRFFFTITALPVDRGSPSRAGSWRTGLLEWWHSMTVPRWKSLSSSVRPFYCQPLETVGKSEHQSKPSSPWRFVSTDL
jgi:hypothetical protein